MIKVFIIGTGNLGTRLGLAFENASNSALQLVGYRNRSNEKVALINAPMCPLEIPECDLILLVVPDDEIELAAGSLEASQVIVAHTSGSADIKLLSRFKNRGVFYLPQTFSKSRSVDFSEITVCLEASNEATMEQLVKVAGTLSRKRKKINSAQRRQLHLAAVYMNNFVNHCYHKATEILESSDMDAALLEPLMEETLKKAQELGASRAQTGPAVRGDRETINKHLELLQHHDREMYRAITQSIEFNHGKKLQGITAPD